MITLANIVGRSRVLDAWDADALVYIANVEAADGAALSVKVKRAINRFVRRCKRDASPVSGVSNWSALKASCLLAGPATLSGALVPLKGPAPTNFNFVGGDYDPLLGPLSNGSTKYLGSNYNNNADGIYNKHVAAFTFNTESNPQLFMLGTDDLNYTEATSALLVSGGGLFLRLGNASNATAPAVLPSPPPSGFYGLSRSPGTGENISWVTPEDHGVAIASTYPTAKSINWTVYKLRPSTPPDKIRISFYSIGAAADLVSLRAAVNEYMEAIA